MSTLKVNTIRNSADVEQYLCKAWVNFNGSGTVAIRAAGNVSSITDNGTGDYTVNFTSAMADANYVLAGSARFDDSGADFNSAFLAQYRGGYTTTTARIMVTARNASTGSPSDASFVHVSIFR
jgi:hypothetical protein